MSDYNRGPYTPGSEPPLAFEDRRAPRRASGPAPVTLILSLLLLVGVGGGVFYMYRGGTRAPGAPPAPVGAPVTDVRVAAPPQAQPTDPADGLSIYKENQGASATAPAFVPPPEQPGPRPVAAAASPPVAAAAPPAAASATPAKPAAKPTSIDALLADNSDVRSPTRPLLKVTPKPPPPAAVKTADAKIADAKAADAKTADLKSKDATAHTAAAAKSGPAVVQIGAFSSKALADQSWDTAANVAPGAMAGKGKHVAPMTKEDGTVLYRAAITGFASHEDAVALCARLKAAGESCFVR